MADSTDLTPAIVKNAQTPNTVSADGVTVTSTPIQDQIAAQKFLAGQDLLQGIVDGSAGLPVVLGRPPGAGGTRTDGCW